MKTRASVGACMTAGRLQLGRGATGSVRWFGWALGDGSANAWAEAGARGEVETDCWPSELLVAWPWPPCTGPEQREAREVRGEQRSRKERARRGSHRQRGARWLVTGDGAWR
ncbi:hypothetical protein ZWY2020_041090 [Hordeum vulgare]|nr:hypothetical protein ZWY2020_041090 [Hordeum vulgare]